MACERPPQLECFLAKSLWEVLAPAFGRLFWRPLLAPTFGAHFWLPLLATTFGAHFWLPFLAPSFGAQFWLPLLVQPSGARCPRGSARIQPLTIPLAKNGAPHLVAPAPPGHAEKEGDVLGGRRGRREAQMSGGTGRTVTGRREGGRMEGGRSEGGKGGQHTLKSSEFELSDSICEAARRAVHHRHNA